MLTETLFTKQNEKKNNNVMQNNNTHTVLDIKHKIFKKIVEEIILTQDVMYTHNTHNQTHTV